MTNPVPELSTASASKFFVLKFDLRMDKINSMIREVYLFIITNNNLNNRNFILAPLK